MSEFIVVEGHRFRTYFFLCEFEVSLYFSFQLCSWTGFTIMTQTLTGTLSCTAQDLNLTEISSEGLRSFHSMVFLLQELGVIGLFSWIKE